MKLAVDASALLAILFRESDSRPFAIKLSTAEAVWISPINWWEVQVHAIGRGGESGEKDANELLAEFNVQVEPVTHDHARLALAAFARYRGRPVRLNLGDCFAYALAKAKGVPLLYKGSDFAATDIEAA
ncbi:MAG: type II toxin-antitoxin system VapC family toxin [Bryobacteraceae bacterium]|nr:type II toxin-antitoxin system VapC family toxin [Bryobacteraceae bacterium]